VTSAAVTPASAFATGRTAVPDAVRVCLGAARDREQLERGLRVFATHALERRTIFINNQAVEFSPARFVRPVSWLVAVLFGLFYGVEGMRVGGARKLKIAPHLGYRDKGVPGVIPPNAVLIAEITFVEERDL